MSSPGYLLTLQTQLTCHLLLRAFFTHLTQAGLSDPPLHFSVPAFLLYLASPKSQSVIVEGKRFRTQFLILTVSGYASIVFLLA